MVANYLCIAFLLNLQVINALEPMLVPRSIKFPTRDEARQVLVDFEQHCRLPMCAGAIDGCLIPIKCPKGKWNFRYWCYKGFDAILLLAVVDARGIFTYVKTGIPGCVGDAAAWGKCALKPLVENGTFFPADCVRKFGDVMVGPYLVGDSAFPFTRTMMKCYNGDPRAGTPNGDFNYALIRTRRVVENAFGRLKMRWRVLKAGRVADVSLVPRLINLCCALHNMAQREMDVCEESVFASDEDHPELAHVYMSDGTAHRDRPGVARAAGVIRDALRDYVHHELSH